MGSKLTLKNKLLIGIPIVITILALLSAAEKLLSANIFLIILVGGAILVWIFEFLSRRYEEKKKREHQNNNNWYKRLNYTYLVAVKLESRKWSCRI